MVRITGVHFIFVVGQRPIPWKRRLGIYSNRYFRTVKYTNTLTKTIKTITSNRVNVSDLRSLGLGTK